MTGHTKRTNTHRSSQSGGSNEKKGLARLSIESAPSDNKVPERTERKSAVIEPPPDLFKQTHLQGSEQSYSKSDTLDSPNLRDGQADENHILKQILKTIN
mmetsp:Transcript_1804/g.2396  ORF Transcript_1804/g.2396 Transcript_1804/m.2396 type:complete len:100 (+) Transcript_1804:1756-2055(+)